MVRVMDDVEQTAVPKSVLVTMQPELMAAVDRWAQRRMSSRAQVMREAAADYLRRQGVLESDEQPAEVAV